MALYVIIALSGEAPLQDAIATQYGSNHYAYAHNVWFVSDDGSSKQVADKIGLTDGRIGAAGAVLAFNAYSGFGPLPAWEWLQQRGSATPNG